MLPVTRIFDSTYGHGSHGEDCCGHSFGGFHIAGSTTVWAENLPVSRLLDIGIHFCPHCPVNMNIKSSKTVLYEMTPSHRIFESVTEFCGMGSSISSCSTVFDGD